MEDQKKYYTLQIRINHFQFTKIEEARSIGITGKMVVQALCEPSTGVEVTIFDKRGKKSITLPKRFLCKKIKND